MEWDMWTGEQNSERWHNSQETLPNICRIMPTKKENLFVERGHIFGRTNMIKLLINSRQNWGISQ